MGLGADAVDPLRGGRRHVVGLDLHAPLRHREGDDRAAQEAGPVELVKNIALRGVRQYNISNEKLGNISVVEGKVVNGFNQPRELIRIEASLYDSAGNALVSKQQLAGTSLSLFQLQVLGEQDIEQALANKIDIMATNTNVLPGGEVPFMVVFYSPPDNAAEFGVKVIDARIPLRKRRIGIDEYWGGRGPF